MSRVFDAYYFENPERYEQEQGYLRAKEDEMWWQYECEKVNALVDEPEQRFILQDGTIIEGNGTK